jgi:hypothetical protein
MTEDQEILPHKSRKNTRRWCKGKVGREHSPVVQHQKERNGWRKAWTCGPRKWGISAGRWGCWHEEVCTTCGKVLRWTLGDECPDRPRQEG